MRVLFIGTGDIGVPTLRSLLEGTDHQVIACVTQPDKPVGRHQELTPSPIKTLVVGHRVPVFQPERIRCDSAIQQIRFLRPEVIVVMAYGQILPGELLRIPTIACLNLHASLLPRHRGAAPIQAAIESGDRDSGVTVIYMNERLDEGDMLLAKSIKLGKDETGGSLHDRLGLLAPAALTEALALLKQGAAPRIPQEHALATYAAKLAREHGEIDWTKTREEIDRRIRAMNPWPSAYTWLPSGEGGKKLKVFAGIMHHCDLGVPPGTVVRADKHGILVAAGTCGILLREVQLEGKKRMLARDFLLGHSIADGTVLGAK
ncbi:MAG: methionyl-tRNA formyltransferase [Chthoniobacteraceae bacterium]